MGWCAARAASRTAAGAFIEITPQGRTQIEQAAPAHVETVRRLIFDVLTDEDAAQLEHLVDKLLAKIDAAEGSRVTV